MEQVEFRNRLTIALPKQEKLLKPIAAFLKSKGLVIEADGDAGILVSTQRNIPRIRIEFVRAADALMLMEEKIADLAIIGSDVANENTCGDQPKYTKPDMRFDLGVAECKFNIAVPDDRIDEFKNVSDLNGARIATSYPNILKEWLTQKNVTPSRILVREGGVEASIRMGLVDVVADLVDTGSTLLKNELTSVFEIASTSAVCYSRKNINPLMLQLLADEFLREIKKAPYVPKPVEYDIA